MWAAILFIVLKTWDSSLLQYILCWEVLDTMPCESFSWTRWRTTVFERSVLYRSTLRSLQCRYKQTQNFQLIQALQWVTASFVLCYSYIPFLRTRVDLHTLFRNRWLFSSVVWLLQPSGFVTGFMLTFWLSVFLECDFCYGWAMMCV